MNNTTWIVVADEGRARIFELSDDSLTLRQVDEFLNEHQSATMLTEKQGAEFSASERKEKEREKFATQIAEFLESSRLNEKFASLKVIAEPKFMGVLLSYLNRKTRDIVSEEISKDYSNLRVDEIEKILKKV